MLAGPEGGLPLRRLHQVAPFCERDIERLETVELEPSVKVPSRYRSTRQPKRGPDGVPVVQPS